MRSELPRLSIIFEACIRPFNQRGRGTASLVVDMKRIPPAIGEHKMDSANVNSTGRHYLHFRSWMSDGRYFHASFRTPTPTMNEEICTLVMVSLYFGKGGNRGLPAKLVWRPPCGGNTESSEDGGVANQTGFAVSLAFTRHCLRQNETACPST